MKKRGGIGTTAGELGDSDDDVDHNDDHEEEFVGFNPDSYRANAAGRNGLQKVTNEDEDIWDVGAIAAMFAMSNRLADLLRLEPNPEFFQLGRQ